MISIVTPNYNYAGYISATIESVLNQDYQDFEHIIVDDGSTDNSVEIISDFVIRYTGKIKLLQQENRGQTHAILTGLKEAKGDIIGWINSDDTYCENCFSRVINQFKENPDADIVFGDMNVMDLSGIFIYRKRHIKFSYIFGSFLGFGNILSSNAIFWKKEVMLKNGYPDVNLKCNMDGEFYSRLTQGKNLVRIPYALANFRKQLYSKAAEKNTGWVKIVTDEIHLELRNSYARLKLSRYIPFQYSGPIKLIYRVCRVIIRSMHFHFLFQTLEKLRYTKQYLNENCTNS